MENLTDLQLGALISSLSCQTDDGRFKETDEGLRAEKEIDELYNNLLGEAKKRGKDMLGGTFEGALKPQFDPFSDLYFDSH